MNRRSTLATLATLAPITLAALTGCGVHSYEGPRGGGGQPGPGAGDIPAFVIDAGAGVNLPEVAYAVTTNGTDWTLAWTGDQAFRHFEGEIIGGGTLSRLQFAGGFQGDSATQVEAGRVQFDASTDGSVNQSITVRSDTQPMRFNLYIDGTPAIGEVVFSSYGAASTTDAMPFDLLTEDQVRAKKGTTVTQARAFTRGGGTEAARAGGARRIAAPSL